METLDEVMLDKHMWENSSKADQYDGLAPPESQQWSKDSSGYSIDWEAEEVRQQIQQTLDFLGKGCTCKTTCKSKRCGCQRNERLCGAGCKCRGCTNVWVQESNQPTSQEEEETEKEDEEEEEKEEEEGDEESECSSEEQVQTGTVTDMDCDNAISICWL